MKKHRFQIPSDLLREPENIPAFWQSSVEDVARFLRERVRKGKTRVIGVTAGGRKMRAVFYGEPRRGRGTTTFVGSLGCKKVEAYRGADAAKKVYLALGAVHGGEFEGIVGMVNLVAVLETGKDLRGKKWAEISKAASRLDRIIVVPIVNMDGRARIPLRMESLRRLDNYVHEYLNTGAWKNGKLIGWPAVKEFIPLDFSKTQFPGGYPNDAGVNIQYDDFFGARQPETQTLLDLATREKPDIVFNSHTGAPPGNYFIRLHRSFIEAQLRPVFDALYRRTHTRLTTEKLQGTSNIAKESDPDQHRTFEFNLDSVFNFHSGALPVLVESPSHAFSDRNEAGKEIVHSADALLDAQLICHQEAMKFLADTGGRQRWLAAKKK